MLMIMKINHFNTNLDNKIIINILIMIQIASFLIKVATPCIKNTFQQSNQLKFKSIIKIKIKMFNNQNKIQNNLNN